MKLYDLFSEIQKIDFEEFEPGECFPTVIVNKTGKRAFKGICLNIVIC